MLKYSEFANFCNGKFSHLTNDELASFAKNVIDHYFSDDPCDNVEVEGKKDNMDTLGNLVDKLAIVTTRMWHAQDELYRYRKMNSVEWVSEFHKDPDKVRHSLARACDLNLQRNQLMDEIDQLFVKSLEMDPEERKKLIVKKHKQY